MLVARVEFELDLAEEVIFEGFMPAGVKRTVGSQRGTSTSLGQRLQPFSSKKVRYFSRISSVFIGVVGEQW